MSLRKSLLFTISCIAIVSSIISLYTIAHLSLSEMKQDALDKAISDLTAKRVLVSNEQANYIDVIEKQATVMANDISLKEATLQFAEAFNLYDTAYGNRESLRSYYKDQFHSVYQKQNQTPVDIENLFNGLPANTVAFQTKYISDNANPLGEKNKLISVGDNSQYDRVHKRYHPSINRFFGTVWLLRCVYCRAR